MLDSRKTAVKKLLHQQKEELKSFANFGYYPELETLVASLPKRKLSGYSQRAQFVKFIYDYILEYCASRNIQLPNNKLSEEKAVKLAVLAEMVIDCQYYENYIFDGKNGVTDQKQIKKYVNAAALLKSNIFKYGRSIFKDDHENSEKVVNSLSDIFDLGNIGQQIEDDWNHYDTFINEEKIKVLPSFGTIVSSHTNENVIKEIRIALLKKVGTTLHERNFMQLYLTRINLISATLFVKFAELVLYLIGVPEQKLRSDIIHFANYFGFFGQLINDNIDIVPQYTGSKMPEDAYSDLRNKNITLPIYYYLVNFKHRRSIIRTILESNVDGMIFVPKLVRDCDRIFKPLHPTYVEKVNAELVPVIIEYAIPAVNKVGNLAVSSIDQTLQTGQILCDLTSIGKGNRFYNYYQIEYRKTQESSSEKKSEKRLNLPDLAELILPKKYVKIMHA